MKRAMISLIFIGFMLISCSSSKTQKNNVNFDTNNSGLSSTETTKIIYHMVHSIKQSKIITQEQKKSIALASEMSNDSSLPLDTSILLNKLQEALIPEGFVFADDPELKKSAQILLQGRFKEIQVNHDGKLVIFYSVVFQMIEVESKKIIWKDGFVFVRKNEAKETLR